MKTSLLRARSHLWYQLYWVLYLIWFFWLDFTFTDKGNGHKVTVDADETFDKGVLWQQDAESFVCMEPWNGWANSVNEEGHHEVLDVDEAMTSE